MESIDAGIVDGILRCLASMNQQDYSLKSIYDSLRGKVSSHRLVEVLDIMIQTRHIIRVRRGYYKIFASSKANVDKENISEPFVVIRNPNQRSKGLRVQNTNIEPEKCVTNSLETMKKRPRGPNSKSIGKPPVTLADHVHAFRKQHRISLE